MTLSASIVLYKTREEDLSRLLDSLLDNSMVTIIYLIDNSPTNNHKYFEKFNNRILYHFNNRNIGYGAAHNIAIKQSIHSGSKYHLILNPDIWFENGTLEKLIEFIDKNQEIGLVMPKVLYPNGRIQYLSKILPNPGNLIFRYFPPLRKQAKKQNEKYELRFTRYNRKMYVPYLSGCFMLIRNSILKQVGGFDERFFMYFEDVDLSRRIAQVSKTVYWPEAVVTHRYEKGSYKNLKLLSYHIASAIKYFNKWGWIFDKERAKINKETLFRLGYNNKKN